MKKSPSIHLIIWPCIAGAFLSQTDSQLGGIIIAFGVGAILYGIYVHFHNKRISSRRSEFLKTVNKWR
ncbi:MAG: hypothetical protein C4527_18500 [Candidatus Omnitrophota bacterium]|jgi:hypothetical protein|nr:MAG: hypothetical protein C4527_18500 [Candidatus Omnitrophota bacterium]